MQDMQNALIRLVAYGRNTDLLPEEDEIYTVNRLLELFEIDEKTVSYTVICLTQGL